MEVTRSYVRRPIVPLNRQQEKLKSESLFLQAFNELRHIDSTRLRQNDRAFEGKNNSIFYIFIFSR